MDSLEIAKVHKKRHKNVLRDIRSRCDRAWYTEDVYFDTCNKKQVRLVFIDQKHADLFEGTIRSVSSSEGLFGSALNGAICAVNSLTGQSLTIEQQVIVGEFIFDFYIPEKGLYIEFDELGSHHKKEHDVRKGSTVGLLIRVSAQDVTAGLRSIIRYLSN